MPPCTSFDDLLEVPEPQSRASTMPTLSPRVTASSAQPVPTMPPPITRMSSSFDFNPSMASERSSIPSFEEWEAFLRLIIGCPASPGGIGGDDHVYPLEFLQV